jgi:GcrA cell cycle regulator
MLASPWPDRDGELRARWAAGETTLAIAEAMGLTKNQVIGRAHRLGLPARPHPIRRAEGGAPRTPRPAPKAARAAGAGAGASAPSPRPSPAPRERERAPAVPAVLARTARCCWPVWPNGAGREHPEYGRYCGAPALLGSSYCPAHHARAGRVRTETEDAA